MIIEAPNRSQLPLLRGLWKEAFGDTDAFLDAFEETAFDPNRCRCITVDGRLVAALYWFDCTCEGRRMAYLYAIATAKAARGQGLCHRLMADTHRHLRALDYEVAILVPGDEGLFAFYGKMGYRVCGYIRSLCCEASAESTEIWPIEGEEYATLRRRLLPRGGVAQEGENLAFLMRQAKLYRGKDFVLAARREGNALVGLELLGNTDAAPAIVRALGCAEGRFRTFGAETPFAMALPLRDGAPLPSYFGLAFD